MSLEQDTTTPSQLAPTSSLSVSSSSQVTRSLYNSYHSQLDSLKRLPVPYGDLYHSLSAFDSSPIDAINAIFRKAASDLSAWLETAEMTVYGLEVDVEQDGISDGRDVGEIDVMMNRFQPNISMLVELGDKMRSKVGITEIDTSLQSDDDVLAEAPMTEQELHQTIQAIESSWNSLKAMVAKVKGILASIRTRGDHLTRMENVLAEIEEIGLKMDSFQEERMRCTPDQGTPGSARSPPSPTLSLSSTTTETMTVASEGAQSKQRNTEVLTLLDSRIELLGPVVQSLAAEIEAQSAGDTEKDGLLDQFRQLIKLWEDLKARREKIGEEIKEERWLGVFDQVAGQVESMMESMDRAIIHCKGLIDQIKNMVREKVIPTAPIDRDHLYTIFKSFEAKHKYYAPAVNKMLNMLENGIETRMTRNPDVIQKHRAMKATWEQLRGRLDRVELDLNDIESMLDILDASIPSYISTPPAQLPEKPLFAMRRPQTQADWKPPNPPTFADTTIPNPVISTFQDTITLERSAPTSTLVPCAVCQHTKTTSPSIPGIPYSPSAASTYTPRSTSSMGNRRDASPSPAPSLSRSASVISRSRSTSCTPSLNRSQSELKPIFSPVGSLSKLSSGVQSTSSSSSAAAPGTVSTIAFGRKTQLKLPPPVVTNSTRLRQNSAPGSAPPHIQSISPMTRSRASSSVAAITTATTTQSSSSARPPVFSPLMARSRRSSMQNGQSSQATDDQVLYRHRRPSLGAPKPISSTYDLDRLDSAYGSVPGSAVGHGNPVFDEPASPSASSSSSISSLGRAQSTQQQQPRRPSRSGLPSLMKEMSIKVTGTVATRPYVAIRGDVLDDEFAKIVNASPVQMQIRRLGEGKYYFGGKVEEVSTGGYSTVGGKMVLCRLMEHGRPTTAGTEEDSGVSSGGSHSGTEDAIQQQLKQRQPIGSRQVPTATKTLRRPEPAAQRNARSRATSMTNTPSTTTAATAAANGKNKKVMVRVGGGWQDLDLFLLDHYSLTNESVALRGLDH
ncbi:hypothetical protein BGX29_009095 [Mortierella sp. GBA35]|nr:hypothetical protein BGX29_009095 [Mortierella sp. GBA35]